MPEVPSTAAKRGAQGSGRGVWGASTKSVHARVLHARGRAIIVVQPMWRGATNDDSLAWRARLATAMNEVGFGSVETKEVHLSPVLAVAVVGIR